MARVSFADIVLRTKREMDTVARQEVQRVAEEFHSDWKSRFGDNDRVGGPELRDSTKRRKGHDRKLVDSGKLREATKLLPPEVAVWRSRSSFSQAVVNTDEKFPWHEYGRFTAKPPVAPRPTLELSREEIARHFSARLRAAYKRRFPEMPL